MGASFQFTDRVARLRAISQINGFQTITAPKKEAKVPVLDGSDQAISFKYKLVGPESVDGYRGLGFNNSNPQSISIIDAFYYNDVDSLSGDTAFMDVFVNGSYCSTVAFDTARLSSDFGYKTNHRAVPTTEVVVALDNDLYIEYDFVGIFVEGKVNFVDTPLSEPLPGPTPTTTFEITPSPTNSATPTPSPTNSATPTPSPTESATPTPTPSFTPTESPTPEPTPTPSFTPTESATPTPSPTESATPTPTPTESATPEPTPTESATPEPTPTITPEGTAYPTPTESLTPTPTPTETITPTPSFTPTQTPTPSFTPTQTPTPSFTPTQTPTPSFTPTETPTPTPTVDAFAVLTNITNVYYTVEGAGIIPVNGVYIKLPTSNRWSLNLNNSANSPIIQYISSLSAWQIRSKVSLGATVYYSATSTNSKFPPVDSGSWISVIPANDPAPMLYTNETNGLNTVINQLLNFSPSLTSIEIIDI